MTDDEFGDVLRDVTAALTSRYYRIPVPDAEISPELRVMSAVTAGLLDGLPGGAAARVLRMLGEMTVDDGG